MKIEQKRKIVTGIRERARNMTPQNLEKYLHFLDSTNKVADFYYEDEKIDFECSSKKKDHIFKHIKVIKEFLNGHQ